MRWLFDRVARCPDGSSGGGASGSGIGSAGDTEGVPGAGSTGTDGVAGTSGMGGFASSTQGVGVGDIGVAGEGFSPDAAAIAALGDTTPGVGLGYGQGTNPEAPASEASTSFVDIAMRALDPRDEPALTAVQTALAVTGVPVIGGLIGVGQAMADLGGQPDPAASGSGVGSQGASGGGQAGGGSSTDGNGDGVLTSQPNPSASQSSSADGSEFGSISEPAPIILPDLEPEPEPEPELSDSEEAQRLRRARRYFGLSGTNVTGPLGLQSPAPVFRPSATPVVTTKRKLGA